MASPASKRARPQRFPRKRSSANARSLFDDLLRDQSLLLRLLLAIAAVLSLTVLVEAWHTPCPHRLGDYSQDGIAARIRFQQLNEYSTTRARDEAAEEVKPIFRTDNAPLESLAARFREDLEAIANAETRSSLSDERLAAFGLATPEPGRDAAQLDADFNALKKAARVPVEGEGNATDTLVKSFSSVVAEIRRHGVTTQDELKRSELRTDGEISILGPDGTEIDVVPTESVLLSRATGPDGFITQLINADSSLSPIGSPLRRWFSRRALVTLKYDSALTQGARQTAENGVEPVFNIYNYRDIIVPPNNRIKSEPLKLLTVEHEAVDAAATFSQRAVRSAITILLITVFAVLTGSYLYHSERRLFNSSVRLAVYLGAILIAVGLGRYLSHDPWRAEIFPIIAIVMVMAIAYDQMLATLTAFTVSALVVLSTTANLGHFVVLMAVCAAVILPLSAVDSRVKLIKIGFLAAVVYFIVSIGIGVLQHQSIAEVTDDRTQINLSVLGAFWCLVACYFIAGSLPFIEHSFGIVTDISLLEMTDVSHPLLQELVRKAPGTYNHSMTVASIGETAADAIGANGLLVRVGAYFHDIGKMLKPQYFIENMTEGQKSLHENLAPAMSTLIIIGHVKDGADLAQEQNLPRRLIDFIEQHHGTTLVEYFYREATRIADQTLDHKADAEESAFRYPGPKPQSKETAVLMLADAVESASRTLGEPTPKRIENLVRGISLKRLLDGQFDESGMTLNEIRSVEESLIKSLIGIYHGRIKYPDQPQ